jgi:TRAP transporter TAXI family solute receptor
MTIATGSKLGPYAILAPLGAGGMGEVYRARDTRLGRDVAVKVLPEAASHDTDRLRRFELEARAVAGLNHPNILVLHDVGSHQGSPYIVSELLEGETLRDRLRLGRFSVRSALEVAIPLARALAAAHERAIVHRDIKPENVFLTRQGNVKVLDFGLAKLQPPSIVELGSESPTEARPTVTGAILGTPSYMSPEQVRGQATDARSDIFSFGAVLFEMLAGRGAFTGASFAEVAAAILTHEPDWKLLPDDSPSALRRLLQRCLKKDCEERQRDATDVELELAEVLAEVLPRPMEAEPDRSARVEANRSFAPGSSRGRAAARSRERIAWLVSAVLLAVVGAMGYALIAVRQSPPTRQVLRLATGPSGSVYHAVGSGIAEAVNLKVPAIDARVVVTEGSLENMMLIDGGQAELALTQNDVAFHAVKTDRVLGRRSPHVLAMAALFGEVAQILVAKDAGIRSISDIRGKAVGVGLPHSGMRFSSRLLLEYFGIAESDFDGASVDPSEGGARVADGSLAASISWAAVPVPGFSEAFRSGSVRLLSLEPRLLAGLRVNNPFYHLVTIPAHAYPGQESDTSTLGVRALLVASRSLDDETVQKILDAMFGSIPDLIAHHPRASEISITTASQFEGGLSIDLHPGARRFYAERHDQ